MSQVLITNKRFMQSLFPLRLSDMRSIACCGQSPSKIIIDRDRSVSTHNSSQPFLSLDLFFLLVCCGVPYSKSLHLLIRLMIFFDELPCHCLLAFASSPSKLIITDLEINFTVGRIWA